MVEKQVLVVFIQIASEPGFTGQSPVAFGHTPFIADCAVELSVLYRMDGRTTAFVVSADPCHCYFSFDYLFESHLLFLAKISLAGRLGKDRK